MNKKFFNLNLTFCQNCRSAKIDVRLTFYFQSFEAGCPQGKPDVNENGKTTNFNSKVAFAILVTFDCFVYFGNLKAYTSYYTTYMFTKSCF